MARYRTCPDCGANLDPGERCDCRLVEPVHNQARRPAPAPDHPGPGAALMGASITLVDPIETFALSY